MPKLMHEMSDQQLSFIANACDKLEEINQICDAEQINYLISGTFVKKYFQKNKWLVPACFDAFDDSMSPLSAYWIATSFFSLGALTILFAIVAAGGVVALFSGAFYYYYREGRVQVQKDLAHVQLLIIKLHALDIVLKRHAIEDRSNHFAPLRSLVVPGSKMKALSAGFAISALMFGTLYWGVTDIMVTVGANRAASVLTGEVAFFVALLASILVGALAANQYHHILQFKQGKIELQKDVLNRYTAKKILFEHMSFFKNSSVTNRLQIICDSGEQKSVADSSPARGEYKALPLPSLKSALGQSFYAKKMGHDHARIELERRAIICPYI
jgi:hypothetical protein